MEEGITVENKVDSRGSGVPGFVHWQPELGLQSFLPKTALS